MIKGLRKNRPQKEKDMKIRPESEQVKMPLSFTFTARIMIMCRLSINAIIHDQLNILILTFQALNFMFQIENKDMSNSINLTNQQLRQRINEELNNLV